MAHILDEIGVVIGCGVTTVASNIASASNQTGVKIQGMGSILFLTTVIVAPTSDGGTSDGETYLQITFSSASSAGSDAAASNTTMSCTDAIITFDTDSAVGTLYLLEFDIEAKGLSDATGYLFPYFHGDSVAQVTISAIPIPMTATMPFTQSPAAVLAND